VLRHLGRCEGSFKCLDGCQFTKPSNGAALFQTPLLVDTDIGRNDPNHIQVVVDPFYDLLSARRTVYPSRLNVNRIRDAHW